MKHMYLLGLVALLIPFASASIQIDAIETDPAIIAAGDTVDVIVRYSVPTTSQQTDSRFSLTLRGADETSEEYISILDRQGIGQFQTLPKGATLQQTFRIKVADNAPAQEYALELVGQWMQGGIVLDAELSERFMLDVKRESVRLSVGSLTSTPQRIVGGDREVQLLFFVANSGAKDALNVEVVAHLPDGVRPSFSSSSRAYLGVIPAHSSQQGMITVDIDTTAKSQEYPLRLSVVYRDENQNTYSDALSVPLFVADKPRLDIISANTSVVQGGAGMLEVTVRNSGEVAAEAIDVRILKESNQPFVLDTRSGYIGKLYPGEQGVIRIAFDAQNTALPGEYNIPLLVRAKGDSDRNDNTVYTYRSRATVHVEESSTNRWVFVGIVIVIAVLGVLFWRKKK